MLWTIKKHEKRGRERWKEGVDETLKNLIKAVRDHVFMLVNTNLQVVQVYSMSEACIFCSKSSVTMASDIYDNVFKSHANYLWKTDVYDYNLDL